jgi:hypothetical protein
VAVSNTYYLARLMRSDKPTTARQWTRSASIWPDQKGSGTHINVSGGGILKNAPHKEAAVKFLEYLASDEAQRYFADGNNEWPVVPGIKVDNPALQALGQVQGRHLAGRITGHVSRQGAGDLRSRGVSLIAGGPGNRRVFLQSGGFSGDGARSAREDDQRQQADRHNGQGDACRFSESLVGRQRVGLRRQRIEIERTHHQRCRQLLHHVDEHQQAGREQAAAQDRQMHPAQVAPWPRPRLRAASSMLA